MPTIVRQSGIHALNTRHREPIVRRILETPSDTVAIEIDAPVERWTGLHTCSFRVYTLSGDRDDSMSFSGIDGMSALMQAIIGAGDHVARLFPDATFAGTDRAGLLMSTPTGPAWSPAITR